MDALWEMTVEGQQATGSRTQPSDSDRVLETPSLDGCGATSVPMAAAVIGQHSNAGAVAVHRRCLVCNDVALGNNFGVLSCESCKAFFRRTALKDKVPRCVFASDCLINEKTRRFCPACRLQKSFAVGMKKEMILGEVERVRRKDLVVQNKVKKSERVNQIRLCAAGGAAADTLSPRPELSTVTAAQGDSLEQGSDHASANWSQCAKPPLSPASRGRLPAAACTEAAGSPYRPSLLTSTHESTDAWMSVVSGTNLPQLSSSSLNCCEWPAVTAGLTGASEREMIPIASLEAHLTPMLTRLPSIDDSASLPAISGDDHNSGAVTVTSHRSSNCFDAGDLPQSERNERSALMVASLPAQAAAAAAAAAAGMAGFGGSRSSSPSASPPCGGAPARRQLTDEQQSTVSMLRNAYVGIFGHAAEVYESRPNEYLKSFEDALNHSANLVRNVVRFAKLIPEFCTVSTTIQLALLKGASLPCILLHLGALYDPITESWGLGYGSDGRVCGRVPMSYGAGVLSTMGSDGLQRHKALLSSLKSQLPTDPSSNSGDEVTDCSVTALLLVLLLLSPEHALCAEASSRPGSQEEDYCDEAADLSDAQQRYTDLLGGYLQASQSFSRAAELLPQMLHQLSVVKVHGRFSLQRIATACDRSRVDPLLQEVFNLSVAS